MKTDPSQLNNIVKDASSKFLEEKHNRLVDLMSCFGNSCRKSWSESKNLGPYWLSIVSQTPIALVEWVANTVKNVTGISMCNQLFEDYWYSDSKGFMSVDIYFLKLFFSIVHLALFLFDTYSSGLA